MSEHKFPTGVVLFISLAVNLLLVGAAVGIVLTGARLHRAAGGPGFGPGPRAFMGALPREKAMEIRQRLEDVWRSSAAERDAARDAHFELLRAVEQDPFDEAKVRTALAKMRAADETLSAKNQDGVISVLKDLTPPERAAALAGILRARGAGPRRGPGVPGAPPPPPDGGAPAEQPAPGP